MFDKAVKNIIYLNKFSVGVSKLQCQLDTNNPMVYVFLIKNSMIIGCTLRKVFLH